MSRKVAGDATRRTCPLNGRKRASARSESSVPPPTARQKAGAIRKAVAAKRQGTPISPGSGGKPLTASGEKVTQKELPAPAPKSRPRVALAAGVDGIETPKRAETPEGAFVAVEAVGEPPEPSIGTPKRSSCEKSGTEEEFGAINRAATKIVCLARDAKDELEALRNISKEVKTSVCNKLQIITELTLRLEESRSRYMFEVEREKAGRAQAMEEAERRLRRESEKYNNKYKIIEANIENMAAELKKTRDAIENMDMPGKMEGLRKTLKRNRTYAAAAANRSRQKPLSRRLWLMTTRPNNSSSRCANHTSDQVVKAIRRWLTPER
ncbi:hypothetical protein EVAR_65720_1 [Eumeta japonica]|uniref:Uncharacterized protein n=1 Tax=Eumeta variegata TaxID=151549 RepID=A0A4C2A8A9_EUMVA|nr:hypothetical protein EVAR_65720_1 [Eumeta japonica]